MRKNTVIAYDCTDINKEDDEKMEGLGGIWDGSGEPGGQGYKVLGYFQSVIRQERQCALQRSCSFDFPASAVDYHQAQLVPQREVLNGDRLIRVTLPSFYFSLFAFVDRCA